MHSKAAAESSNLEKARDTVRTWLHYPQDDRWLIITHLTPDATGSRQVAASPSRSPALSPVIASMLSGVTVCCLRSTWCAPSVIRSFGEKYCPLTYFQKELPCIFPMLTSNCQSRKAFAPHHNTCSYRQHVCESSNHILMHLQFSLLHLLRLS
jgi:hypothetical protein